MIFPFKINNKEITFDILIILIAGLLSITWFNGNYIIASQDFIIPFQWLPDLSKIFYSWDHTISMGVYSPRDIAFSSPIVMYLSLAENLGLSIVWAEKILLYIWFASAGLSMYMLAYILKIEKIGRLASAFFYMMNPITLYTVWAFAGGLFQPFYVYAPLILGLYIYGIRNKKGMKYIIFFVFILLLTSTSAYANPVYAILQFAPVLLYFIYFLITEIKNKISIKKSIIFTVSFFIIWVLINSFWIFPTIIGMKSEASRMAAGVDISNLQSFKDNSMTIYSALRLVGFWALEGYYKGDPYFTWGPLYSSNLFVFLELMVPMICFLSLLKKRTVRYDLIYFAILSIILFFLIKGPNPPLGYINIWILQNIPFWDISFRNPITKFGLMIPLGLAPLLGYGINDIHVVLRRKSFLLAHTTIFIIFILLFFVLVFPIWTGEVIQSDKKVIPSKRLKIPEYYNEASEYLHRQNGDYRLFPLPMSKRYHAAYSWESGYAGADLTSHLLGMPTIASNTGDLYYAPMLIGKETEKITTNRSVGKILSLLNVKYIVLHRDTKWEYIRDHPWWFDTKPSKLDSFLYSLSQEQYIMPSNSFGELDFYKMSDVYFLPHIYTAQAQLMVPELQNFSSAIESSNFVPGYQNIIVLDQNQNRSVPQINSTTRPTIFFQKINPTKYIVKVENANEPFWLTFSESYQPGWRAYINTDLNKCNPIASYTSLNIMECQSESKFFEFKDITRIFDQSIPENDHFVVNSYANGWYIDPQQIATGKDFTITLYFKPQTYSYFALIISGLALITCLCYLYYGADGKKTSKQINLISGNKGH